MLIVRFAMRASWARVLKVCDRCRRDRGERQISEMFLDEAQALLFELNSPR